MFLAKKNKASHYHKKQPITESSCT